MKNFRFVSLFVAALVMGSVAQAQQTHVQSSVPFNFMIGDRAYSSGDYAIKQVGDNSPALRIDNVGEGDATLVLSNPCSLADLSKETKLVFHRVGGSYFLYQIWTEGNRSGRQFPVSKTEIRMASNQAKTDVVIVAANIIH
jgi:hypothetical protein